MTWNLHEPLETIAEKSRKAHFSSFDSSLLEMPSSIIERCWAMLEGHPANEAAARILFYNYLAEFEETNNLEVLCQLVQMLDVVSPTVEELIKDIGLDITIMLGPRYFDAKEKKGLTDELQDQDSLIAIERVFLGVKETPESLLVGGLLFAGYSAFSAGDAELANYSLTFGLRGVYAFFRAGRPDLAKMSLKRSERLYDEIEAGLSEEHRTLFGGLYFATAIGAEMGGDYEVHLLLLEKSKLLLPPKGDDYAECMFNIGLELQRRGKSFEALEAYEEGRQTPDVAEEKLSKILEVSVTHLRGVLEGNFSEFSEAVANAAETFGVDPTYVKASQRIAESIVAGQQVREEDERQAIEGLKTDIERSIKAGREADAILQLHVLLFMLALELDDAEILRDLASWIDQAESFAKEAAPATRLKYEQIRKQLPHKPLLHFDILKKIEKLKNSIES